MPCYCEIERRCKERMYFDSQGLLTREQAQECEKRHLKAFPMGNINDHLCKLCKVLTEEQMKKISAYQWLIKWSHKTLYDWHIQHCKDDDKNEKDGK